jgi:hypothetical protein
MTFIICTNQPAQDKKRLLEEKNIGVGRFKRHEDLTYFDELMFPSAVP